MTDAEKAVACHEQGTHCYVEGATCGSYFADECAHVMRTTPRAAQFLKGYEVKDKDNIPGDVGTWFAKMVKEGTCNELAFEERRHGIGGHAVGSRLAPFLDVSAKVSVNMIACSDGEMSRELQKVLKDLLATMKSDPNRSIAIKANQCTATLSGYGLPIEFHFLGDKCTVSLPSCKSQAGTKCYTGHAGAANYGWCAEDLPLTGGQIQITSCLKCPDGGGVYTRTSERGECVAKLGVDVPALMDSSSCFDFRKAVVALPRFSCEQKCKCAFQFADSSVKRMIKWRYGVMVRAENVNAAASSLEASESEGCRAVCADTAPAKSVSVDLKEGGVLVAPASAAEWPVCTPSQVR